MKGIGPIALAIIVVVVGLLLSGAFFNMFIGTTVIIRETIKEKTVLNAVNKMESIKIGVEHALYYSFSQGAYEVLLTGGYDDLSTLRKEDDTPYWRVYDKTYYPADYLENIASRVDSIFEEYRKASVDVFIPDGEIEMTHIPNGLLINFHSTGLLKYETEFVRLYDNPNTTLILKDSIKTMFERSREMFIDQDSIRDKIVEACQVACTVENIRQELKSLEQTYDGIEIQLDVKNIITDGMDGAALVLVIVRDKENEYPVYDYLSHYTNLELRFYVLSGTKQLI